MENQSGTMKEAWYSDRKGVRLSATLNIGLRHKSVFLSRNGVIVVSNVQIDLFLAHLERRMCRGVDEFGRRHGRCSGRVCS